jgi:hypothetical protein
VQKIFPAVRHLGVKRPYPVSVSRSSEACLSLTRRRSTRVEYAGGEAAAEPREVEGMESYFRLK